MAAVVERIVTAFDDFRGAVSAFDDVTVIGLRVPGRRGVRSAVDVDKSPRQML